MNKLILIPLLLLFACSTTRPLVPVELPNNLKGYFLSCTGDVDCEIKAAGICDKGYSIYQYSKNPDGWIISCK